MSDPGDEDQVAPRARELDRREKVSDGLHSWTQRMEVPGGWLYRTVVRDHVAMCFVPAPVEPADELPLTPEEEAEAEARYSASLSMFTPAERTQIANAALDHFYGRGKTFKEELEERRSPGLHFSPLVGANEPTENESIE